MCVNAYDIIAVLNPEYLSGVPVLQILSLSQLMFAIVGPVALILTMTHYVRLNLFDLLLTLILSVVLDLILIPRFGAVGAAIAGMISIIFINLIRLAQVYKLFGIHPYNLSYLKPLIASILAVLASLGAIHLLSDLSHLIRLFVVSFVILIVYGTAIMLFGQDETDRDVFRIIFRDAFTWRLK
jgi:O-antigen/teichoic acid export membrane protein